MIATVILATMAGPGKERNSRGLDVVALSVLYRDGCFIGVCGAAIRARRVGSAGAEHHGYCRNQGDNAS